ncbi:unnamed protein product [Dovyalis caffra]|uniref:Uncharacterized protein n=1 Tax=Dovyalis caffra TaxID=77055 RepID=A0AAV1SFP9_9ROSI|nr:unnamed protein product [Dovyalis caffra]
MKGLFKPKPRTPMELVLQARDLLIFLDHNTETRERKREEKILEIRIVLFGNGQAEPNPDACAHLAQEFFKEDTLRLLIVCLPKLDLGARQNATHVIANLQRQRVSGRLIASDYEDGDIALTYGAISRECIRHQIVARFVPDQYVLGSEHMKKFFTYIQIPNFDIASDAQATFKVKSMITDPLPHATFTQELLTRHKSTVAEFLSANYDWERFELKTSWERGILMSVELQTPRKREPFKLSSENDGNVKRRLLTAQNRLYLRPWIGSCCTSLVHPLHFFQEYNSQLLESPSYITRRHAVKLLGDMLLDRSNSAVMVRYVSSLDNMRILMNLFRDEQFEADKSQVIKEIATLEIISNRSCTDADNCEVES